MTGLVEDPLEMLSTGLPAGRRALAGRLTRALCLFHADSVGEGSPSAAVHADSAVTAFEEHQRSAMVRDLLDVAAHVGNELVHEDSFLAIDLPERDYAEVWRALLRSHVRTDRSTRVPRLLPPGASGLVALDSVLAALQAEVGEGDSEIDSVALWQVRRRWISAQLRQPHLAPNLERATRESIECELAAIVARAQPLGAARRAAALDLVALRLDGRSRDLARAPGMARPASMGDCRTASEALALFAAWADGAESAFPWLAPSRAKELGIKAGPWRELSHLERPPAEESRDAGALVASGRQGAPTGEEAGAKPNGNKDGGQAIDRKQLGACAVIVCRIEERCGSVELVGADVAPGLREHLGPWIRGREGAIAETGTPEHEAIRSARTVTLVASHRTPKGAHGFRRSSIRRDLDACPKVGTIHVEPLVDEFGAGLGFVWIETESPIVPSSAQRRALLERVAPLVSRARPCAGESRGARVGAVEPTEDVDPRDTCDPPLQRAWEDALARITVKLAERRWAVLHADGGGGLALVACGGEGELGTLSGRSLEAGVSFQGTVSRVFRTGGAIRYGAETESRPASHATLFEGAQTGALIPLKRGRSVHSILCLESLRRGDPRDVDVRRIQAALGEESLDLAVRSADLADRTARFPGIAVEADDPASQQLLQRLERLASSHADVLVAGPVGGGRATIARLLAHLSCQRRRGAPVSMAQFSASGLSEDCGQFERLESLQPESFAVLTDVDRLGADAVDRLVAWRRHAGHTDRPRLLMTGGGRHQTVDHGSGRWAESAASRQCVTVRLAPLVERRQTIPRLTDHLLRRIAMREGRSTALLDDEGKASLWRQSWPGEVAQLGAVLETALTLTDARELTAATIATALCECGLEPIAKLPSRDPGLRSVASALWLTRTGSQRVNKSRAALYLGWDPATVASRMRDFELAEIEAVRAFLALS